MPLSVSPAAPTLFIRRDSFERAGLTRAMLDASLGLTPDEFRVEGALVAVGPLYAPAALEMLVDQLEALGLEFGEDFFELSGNWPSWLRLFAMSADQGTN